MKKYKLTSFTVLIIGMIITSCDPSVEAPGSDDKSKITYLPKITLEGETDIELPCDATSYTDPGAIAEAGGESIDIETNITGNYFEGTSVDGPDVYSISYQAYNDEDIPAAAFRSVFWPECNGDLVTSIAGVYTVSVSRNGSSPAGYQDNGPFIIKDLGDDRYAISDAQGGWYEYGRKLGPDYLATGMILKANDIANNDFTSEGDTTVRTFGGVVTFVSLEVDPVNKTIELTTEWDFGYTFVSTLTQVSQ